MSDGPQPVHPDIQKLNEAWQDGYYGRYADTYRLRDAASQQAYGRGRRAREAGRVDSGGAPDQKQTLGEAVSMAFGLAGAAAGFVLGEVDAAVGVVARDQGGVHVHVQGQADQAADVHRGLEGAVRVEETIRQVAAEVLRGVEGAADGPLGA